MRLIALITILAFLAGCSGDREVVSLVSLIANPDDYDGEEVVVSAFLLARKENQAIYLSKEHAVNGIAPSAVWISVSENTVLRGSRSEGGWNHFESIESFDGMYVMVTGTFQKDGESHGEFFAGILENITMIQTL